MDAIWDTSDPLMALIMVYQRVVKFHLENAKTEEERTKLKTHSIAILEAVIDHMTSKVPHRHEFLLHQYSYRLELLLLYHSYHLNLYYHRRSAQMLNLYLKLNLMERKMKPLD